MITGTYVGKIQALVGKTALLQYEGRDFIKAQFDVGKWAYGWHKFPQTSFTDIVIPEYHDFRDDGDPMGKKDPDPNHWSRWEEKCEISYKQGS